MEVQMGSEKRGGVEGGEFRDRHLQYEILEYCLMNFSNRSFILVYLTIGEVTGKRCIL